jgi:hypothetical protein
MKTQRLRFGVELALGNCVASKKYRNCTITTRLSEEHCDKQTALRHEKPTP